MIKKLLLGSLALVPLASQAQTVVGLTTDEKVIKFDVSSPGTFTQNPVQVTGIISGQLIVGMDFRPSTGELFILGYRASDSTAKLYRLNSTTGVATPLDSTMKLVLGNGPVAFDFNPTVDRIRVIGAKTRRNYRLNPNGGGVVAATDSNLAYTLTDINAARTPYVVTGAYTNSYLGTSATALYDFDDSANVFALQNPPNNGRLNTVNPNNPASGLPPYFAVRNLDMDVYFSPVSKTNTGYLAANSGQSTNDSFYSVNLTSGKVTTLGLIGTVGNGIDVKNIAMLIDRTVPATYTGQLIYATTRITGTALIPNLISFSSGDPETIRSYKPITGMSTQGNTAFFVGMDFRPATRTLYGATYNLVSHKLTLYTIDTATAAATPVDTNNAPVLNLGSNFLNTPVIGFDFNPVSDRIRVVTSTVDSNYAISPVNNTVLSVDTPLVFRTGDVNAGKNPAVGSVAYTNSYKNATSTVLYGIDDSASAYVSIVPPNSGKLTTVANAVLNLNKADRSNDLDFYYDSTNSNNIGYLMVNLDSLNTDILYTVNVTTGAVTKVDTIGYGLQLGDIAVVPTYAGLVSTSVNELAAKAHFLMQPNPASEAITVKLPVALTRSFNVIVRDLSGRLMSAQTFAGGQEATISISNLQPGNYLMTVEGADLAPSIFVKY